MRPKLRIGLLLVSGILLVGGIAYAYTDLANASDSYFSNGSSFDEMMELEERTSQRLESERRAVQGSIEMKQALIEDLVAERVSFVQAAREFQEINSMRPNLWVAFQSTQPGKTKQELTCDQILSYVRGMLKRNQDPNCEKRIAAFEKMATDYLQSFKIQ
jgi:hypothetical protein